MILLKNRDIKINIMIFKKKEYENQFNDYRDEDENDKQKYIIEK